MSKLDDFLEDAARGPWRPEDKTGVVPSIWLTNDHGDLLQVDDDAAAMLVNAALRKRLGRLDKSLAGRLWSKVDNSSGQDGCWPFTGALSTAGYGHFAVGGRFHNAHRVAYQLVKGEIPEGLVIDHLCRNRRCCNPAHLEAVTTRENLLRSPLGAGGRAKRTHCPQGHEYTPENTVLSDRNQRWCRTCRNAASRIRGRAYYAASKRARA